jgi:hypothetical protein
MMRKIMEAQKGQRSEYRTGLLQFISRGLSTEFGKGFTVRNLQAMRQFYAVFPNTHALRAELSWTHYRLLMRIDNEPRREFKVHAVPANGGRTEKGIGTGEDTN